MLYALAEPFSFAVLLVTFIVGIWVRGCAQRAVVGVKRPKWARDRMRRGQRFLWLKPFVDPYGCLAAAIGGVGWGTPTDPDGAMRRPSGRRIAAYLVGPVVLVGLGIGALVGFRAWLGGHVDIPTNGLTANAIHGDVNVRFDAHFVRDHFRYTLPFGQVALFLAGVELLAMGVLSILPLPPLDGGRFLFALAPRTRGWQRARLRLDDENWGVLILLILALPVFGLPMVLSILDAIVDPIIRAVL